MHWGESGARVRRTSREVEGQARGGMTQKHRVKHCCYRRHDAGVPTSHSHASAPRGHALGGCAAT